MKIHYEQDGTDDHRAESQWGRRSNEIGILNTIYIYIRRRCLMKNTSNDLAQNERRAGTTCAIHACGVRYTIMLNDAMLALLGKSKASMTRVHGQPSRVV